MSPIKFIVSTIIVGASLFVMSSCGGDTPKPIGYFRITLPAHKTYKNFSEDKFPLTFAYPDSITQILVKPARKEDKYSFNIIYPKLHGCIYCDYRPLNGDFRKISEDFRDLVYKHTAKADGITEQPYLDPEHKVYALLYELQGNTASQMQFVITDSTQHIFRGSLYFNNTPNADSLKPVTQFVKADIVKLIESFRWK